jgi:hypothetical protein
MTPQTTWRHATPFSFQEPIARMPIINRKPQNSIGQSIQLLTACMENNPTLKLAEIAVKLGWKLCKVRGVRAYMNGKVW